MLPAWTAAFFAQSFQHFQLTEQLAIQSSNNSPVFGPT